MPGPRTDIERAWQSLAEVLSQHQTIAAALAVDRGEEIVLCWRQDETQALSLLQKSGRLSATQIRLVRKLVQAVIRTERNCGAEEF